MITSEWQQSKSVPSIQLARIGEVERLPVHQLECE